jgi:hypothetical protein
MRKVYSCGISFLHHMGVFILLAVKLVSFPILNAFSLTQIIAINEKRERKKTKINED